MLPFPAPRDLDELRAYMRMGIGLAMRHTQKCHPALAAVAAEVGKHVPGEVQVQVFVTPAGTHGFGWHYDAEDVFIAQTVGCKDYYFARTRSTLTSRSRRPTSWRSSARHRRCRPR